MASIVYHQKRSDAVVGLENPLDCRAAAALEKIGEEIAVDVRPIVSVSLRNIRSVDAAGISGLLRFHRHVRNMGGTVYLTGVRWELAEIFRLTGLDQVFNITPSTIQEKDISVVENRNPIQFLSAPAHPAVSHLFMERRARGQSGRERMPRRAWVSATH